MAEPTVKQGNKYFANTLYEGNGTAIGSGGKTITGLEFQPDFTWIKNRDATDSHSLYDSSRGVTKQIESDNTSAETTESEGLTSFTSDGFTLGSLDQVNTNNESFVGWNWKANGGTTASNSNGSITSTVQANTTAGFSIVQYTGTGSAATVGHGLSSAPEWFIIKSTSLATSWYVYHKDTGTADYEIYLNLNSARYNSGAYSAWNNTAPTSSVISLAPTGYGSNNASATYVIYAWHSVDGFSKFGKFVGNGSTDGTFVYTGFRPAFVLIKNTAAGNWYLKDTTRDTFNVCQKTLMPNLTNAEAAQTYIDILANGFKQKIGNDASNLTSNTYVYIAFAEHPFVGDGTNPVTAR